MNIFPEFRAREIWVFEPVRESNYPAGLEESCRGGEKLFPVLIVRDRFHRPDHIERLFEGHGLRVHQAEPSIGTLTDCRRIGHFDLHLGNGDSGGCSAKLLAEIEAAGAESASDVQNRRALGNLCEAREVLDQLLLRLLLGFVAADPVPVMKMLAPQFVVVGANDVVMLDDLALCVGQRHQTNVPHLDNPSNLPGSRIVVASRCAANGCGGRRGLRSWNPLPFSTIVLNFPGDRLSMLDPPAQRRRGGTHSTPKPKRTARHAEDVCETEQSW